MKTKAKQTKEKIEKIEFQFSNGTCIVWVKNPVGWIITKYVHGEQCKSITSVSHLPSILNANYFNDKL